MRTLLFAVALLAITGPIRSAPEPRLHRSRLTLAPSARQLQALPRFDARWVVPDHVAAGLGPFFVSAGFRPDLADELLARLRPGVEPGTRAIVPDRALLARFTPAERARWWEVLQVHPSNYSYRWPLSLGPDQISALATEPRWSEALARIRATALPHGERLVFGDLFALEDAFASEGDRRDFFHRVLGAPAPILKLRRRRDRPLDAAAQAAWWQVNGRHRAIEPLLNAVAAIPNAPRLDVAHLLPRLGRSLLNTFPPELTADDNPGVDSGLFASEFFGSSPGADSQAPGGLKAWLERECIPVDGPPQYGDLLVFGDLDRSAWPYTAVYIARGLVFARRPTAFGPWQFLGIDEIGRLNPRYAREAPRAFRTRSAVVPAGEPPFLPGRMPEAWRNRLRLKPVPPGPWGRLWYFEVLLAPSGNTLEALPAPDARPIWTFVDVSPAEIRATVDEVEMPAHVRAELLALFRAATPDAAGRITVRPSLELVLAVPREFRTRLFPRLVGGDSITDYAQHIPFPPGFTIEQWFDAGSLPEPVRQAILRLAYPVGGRVMLSDFGALYSLLPSRREQLSAHRAALRVPAVVLLMEKPAPAEVPALAAYWQLGRAKDVGVFLQSFASEDQNFRYIDVIHLLSPIEREFLNTYFTPAAPSLTPSCFWTAFNFGADQPDNRYLVLPGMWTEHQRLAWKDLSERYTAVPAPGQLGDIIAYRRRGAEEVEHVCVFIAEGIAFTKNGYAFSQPWCLSRLEDIDALYLTNPDMERIYFRRRAAGP